jgi:hypothetical protein
MQTAEYHTKDFIVSGKKVFNSDKNKSNYSLFLISDEDKEELISALKSYFGQLRKKRVSYLHNKNGKSSKVKHKEPQIIILNNKIKGKEAQIIDKESVELKNEDIPICDVFKYYIEALNKKNKNGFVIRRHISPDGSEDISDSESEKESDNSDKE